MFKTLQSRYFLQHVHKSGKWQKTDSFKV